MKNRMEKYEDLDGQKINNNDAIKECRNKFYSKLCELSGLEKEFVAHVFRRGKFHPQKHISWPKKVPIALTVSFLVMAGVVTFAGVVIKVTGWDEKIYTSFRKSHCLLKNRGFTIEIARPLMNCDCCRNSKRSPWKGISPQTIL